MKIIIAATMKPYIATTIAIAVLCNSALANFIDPSKPTIQDEADESAIYHARTPHPSLLSFDMDYARGSIWR